jgi:hypothetical protein
LSRREKSSMAIGLSNGKENSAYSMELQVRSRASHVMESTPQCENCTHFPL